jgi:hypothetical protein
MKYGLGAALLCGLLATTGAAQAGTITYGLKYTTVTSGATASGFVSFNDAVLPNGPVSLSNISAAALGVVDWGLTVTGATSGNGTFTLADIQAVAGQQDGWLWVLSAPINLNSELVAQAGFSDFNWCAGTASCGSATAPGGSSAKHIQTNGETGEILTLVSMTPESVPEPFTLSLFGAGLAGAVAMRRRKKS